VVLRLLPHCTSQVVNRGAQAAARGAAHCAPQVLSRGAQAVARGAARCASQVLDRCARAVVRDAAGCALQVLDLSATPLVAAGEEQLGRCTAGQSRYNLLYLCRAKVALAAM
jgi:hypothetical protein